jgi:hypothetical protein
VRNNQTQSTGGSAVCSVPNGAGITRGAAGFKDIMSDAVYRSVYEELKAEELEIMPDELNTGDFGRWTLKFSIHFIGNLPKQAKAKLKRNNPLMLIPEQLALEFKERILRHIKPCYVSEVEARGHERLFHGGTYCFRQAVPRAHLIEALRKADLIT